MDIYTRLQTVGQTLKTARKYKGMTMQEVADKAGLCRQTISDVENGHGKIGLETYLAIADTLGVDIVASIKPQVIRRRKKDVSLLNGFSFIASDGTKCSVIESPKTLAIKYTKNGSTHSFNCNYPSANSRKPQIEEGDVFAMKYIAKTHIEKTDFQETIKGGEFRCRKHTT